MNLIKNSMVHWREMDGETDDLRKLNSLITSALVGVYDIPADECVSHAKAILAHYHTDEDDWKPKAVSYLKSMFATAICGKTGAVSHVVSQYPACVETIERAGAILRGGPWPDKLVAV